VWRGGAAGDGSPLSFFEAPDGGFTASDRCAFGQAVPSGHSRAMTAASSTKHYPPPGGRRGLDSQGFPREVSEATGDLLSH